MGTYRTRVKNGCTKQYYALKKALFWDSFIRYAIESNLDLCYENIFFIYMYMSFDTQDEAINTLSRLFFVILIGFFIIWSTCFIICNRGILEEVEVQAKYGSMYEDIKTNKLTSALYSTVFCIRRLCLVLAILLLKDKGDLVLVYAFIFVCSANFVYLT